MGKNDKGFDDNGQPYCELIVISLIISYLFP